MVHKSDAPFGRSTLMALALLLAVVVALFPARAQESLFLVDGIEVDKTAKDSNVARDTAIAQGRMKAWQVLVERIVPKEQRGALPRLKYKDVRRLIREYSIVEEKASAVRYIATLQFRFDEDKVRAVLEEHGVGVVEAPVTGKAVLVLAIRAVDGKPVLWEEGNDWRLAWESYRRGGGFVKLVTPLADLEDIQSITLKQALEVDNKAMNTIAGRYGAGAVVLVGLSRDDAGAYQVAVKPWVLGQTIKSFRVSVKAEEAGEGLRQVVAATAQRIDEAWKTATTGSAVSGPAMDLTATVVVASLAEWVEIKSRLEAIPMLSKIERISVKPGEARVNLVMHGEMAQFEMALEQMGLVLNQGFGDVTISRIDDGSTIQQGQGTQGPEIQGQDLPGQLGAGGLPPTGQGGLAPLPIDPLPPANGQIQQGEVPGGPAVTGEAPPIQSAIPPSPEPRKSIDGMQVEDLPPVGN